MADYDDAEFEQVIAARMAGRVVRKQRLVKLDFLSKPAFLWEGTGVVRDANGQEYYGTGTLGSIGDIESQSGTAATQIELKLSGISPAIVYAAANELEYYERELTIGLQHFDEEWNPLDELWSTAWGTMYNMKIETERDKSKDKRKITLVVENVWNKRGFSAFGYMGDREQKRFSPDDRGGEFFSTMQAKSVTWPIAT